ncbi:MAG: tetratricopeptide repeat-containing sulfotransferase family protein [Phycisphaerales bacterium JB058]
MPPAPKPTPQQIDALGARAHHFLVNGRPHEAIKTLMPVIQFAQKMPKILLVYAQALGNINQHDRCSEMLRAVCKQVPSDPHPRTEYAVALARCGKYEAALENIRKARVHAPHYTRAANIEAEVLMDLGRNEEALETIETYLRETPEDKLDVTSRAHICSTRSRLAPKFLPIEDVVDDVVAFAKNKEVKAYLRGSIAARAAKLLDAVGRYDEAIELTKLSKDIRDLSWDYVRHTKRADAMIAAWTSEAAARLPRSNADGSGMVFVLGMPRSGTSLLEQMLARHPEVQATGERNDLLRIAGTIHPPRPTETPMVSDFSRLSPQAIDQLSRMLVGEINSRREKGVRYVIDKQPFNYLYVPLIAMMLPGAKVLHTVRDGRDTCVSYYMQWFNTKHGQCNSFDTLGRYYADYRRIMDAWKSLPAPDQRPEMIDVSYEALVAEPERVMREVMDFLGMAFDPVVLDTKATDRVVATASRDQVKKEIYTTSVARWKCYEKHLAPFMRHAGQYFEDA